MLWNAYWHRKPNALKWGNAHARLLRDGIWNWRRQILKTRSTYSSHETHGAQRMVDSNSRRNNKPRVAIVSPSLAAYRVPVFNRLRQIPGIDLQVIFAD